jgi:hypothetical protein
VAAHAPVSGSDLAKRAKRFGTHSAKLAESFGNATFDANRPKVLATFATAIRGDFAVRQDVGPKARKDSGVETSLHRELKAHYAGKRARFEVPLGDYRIDVVRGRRLIEIQHGSLAAIRDKVRRLLEEHSLLVVKPIIVRKQLVKLDAKDGEVVDRRLSPKRGKLLDLFDDLVHFTKVFPHRRLTLDVPLVDVEEWRYPGHGRRRRRRETDHQVADQKLLGVSRVHRFRTAADLACLLPGDLPRPFDTADLAAGLEVPRWIAQRVAYCLRHAGTIRQVGKAGNALRYDCSPAARKRLRAKRPPGPKLSVRRAG